MKRAAGIVCLLLLATRADATVDLARFVESRIKAGGELLGYECPDVDGDGRGDLALVVKEEQSRALLVFLQTPEFGFPELPSRRWPLLPDVISYCFFPLTDAADSPGLELLLFTRSSVFAASTAKQGLKGNLTKVLDVRFFPDVPAAESVPRFEWVRDVDGDGAPELIVPSPGWLSVFTLNPDPAAQAPRFLPRGRIPLRGERHRQSLGSGGGLRAGIGGGRRRGSSELFSGNRSTIPTFAEASVLHRSDSFDTPALVDWNGDGRLDAVREVRDSLEVMLLQQDGEFTPGVPRRIDLPTDGDETPAEEVAADDDDENDDRERGETRLLDLDGDRRVEVFVVTKIGDGLENDHVAVIHGRAPDGDFAPEPLARVKISAAGVEFAFEDVDGDGRQDLIAKAIELPTALKALTEVYLDVRLLVFRGQPGGGVSKKPDARFERRLRPENLARIRETLVFDVSGDYDGDGLHDLVLIQPDGLLEIVPLARSGDGLTFSSDPSSSVRPDHFVRSATAAILSFDRVSDLVLRHEDGLSVFVSVPP